jgi:hypothetical protein
MTHTTPPIMAATRLRTTLTTFQAMVTSYEAGWKVRSTPSSRNAPENDRNTNANITR